MARRSLNQGEPGGRPEGLGFGGWGWRKHLSAGQDEEPRTKHFLTQGGLLNPQMWTGWAERGAGEGAEGRRGDLATVTAERGAGLQLPPHRPALPSGKPGLALVGVDRCLQAVLGALGFRRGAKVGTPRSRYVGLAEGKSAGRTGASGSLSNRSPSICWAVHSIVQGASESERGVCAVLEAGLVPALEGGARLRLPAPDAADGGLNHGSSPPRGWESEPQVLPARPRARSWVLGEGLRPGSQGRLLPGSHTAKNRRALSGVSSYKAPVPC